MRYLLLILLITTVGFAQSVIVNEMSQGSDGNKEWVELLVVDDNVDMRGWELGDNDDGTWHSIAEFTTNSDWSSVSKGTIIVLYNDGDVDGMITSAGGEDTDFADKVVLIPISNTTYLSDTGGWPGSGVFGNSDRDDCAAIRDGSDVMIHDMAGAHPSADVPSPASGSVKYYTSNSAGGTASDGNWTEAASTSGTPGEGNGGDNTTWIDTALPVRLANWIATSKHGEVVLSWVTVSELENQGFIIYRDDIEIASFITHETLKGNGSSNVRTVYSFTDKDVSTGVTYRYQLIDVDYQGVRTSHEEINVTVVARDENLMPGVVRMHAAYPNPFNPEVTLTFALDEAAASVDFSIFDLKGNRVKTLTTGSQTAGEHSYVWRGFDDLGLQADAGTYLVKLTAGNQQVIQRITYLR